MKNAFKNQGFTLLELLIGMLMLGIILGAVVSYFQNSSRAALISVNRSEMQQDILNAQQFIAGRLREAWYIYPPNTTLILGAGTAKTLLNPNTGNNTWTIDGSNPKDPIIAMILPPKNRALTCPTTGTANDGCYRFYAYYAEKRSDWLAGNAVTSAENPGADSQNPNAWVLVQYNRNLVGFDPTSTAAIPLAPTGGSASLLADYIAPTIVPSGMTSAAYNMFTLTSPTFSGMPAGAAGVTINLATLRQGSNSNGNGTTTLRLPDATNTYSLSSFPTNLGKFAAK